MTAVDDLTELVERAAAAEKVVLALKWRELGRPSPGGASVGSAEYGNFVAQDEQLDVLGCRCAPEQCQRAE
jgi:hypothetical protein